MSTFATFKRALNAAAPVNRLPSEVLRLIFSCSITSHPLFGSFSYYLPHTTFSGVCKHWRQVILSDPLVWNVLASHDHPSLVETALQWSQNLPLKAFIWCCRQEFVDLVQPHVSSIQHLTCDLTRAPAPGEQPLPLVVVSPVLERLELRRCSITGKGRMLSISKSLPRRVVARISLPESLRRLSLFFTPLTYSFIHLTTLTNVSLQGIVAPFEKFLLLLKNNIHLAEIRVTDVLFEDADQSGETISLPHLRKFSYSGDAIYPFLHRLSAPQRTQFNLRFTDTLNHPVAILPDVLPASLTSLGMLPIDFISLQIDHPSCAISICDSKGGGVFIWWLDEGPSNTANWDLLDLRAVRKVYLSTPPTLYPNPAHLLDINTLLGKTSCLDTLSISNQGGMYKPLVWSIITPGSMRGLWPSLNKIRVASPVQGFPFRELVSLVKVRKEAEGISDIRHVDVLVLGGGSICLEELERLVNIDVKVIDSWMVPAGWEKAAIDHYH